MVDKNTTTISDLSRANGLSTQDSPPYLIATRSRTPFSEADCPRGISFETLGCRFFSFSEDCGKVEITIEMLIY